MKTFYTILFIFLLTGFMSCTKESANASGNPQAGPADQQPVSPSQKTISMLLIILQ